jgi:predicted ATPase/class 3 adenylate cyclase
VQCRQCHRENPAEARFCLHCGAPQALRCGSCDRELPAEARFCMGCGHPVGTGATSAGAATLGARSAEPALPASRPSRAPLTPAVPMPATLGGGRYLVKGFLGEGARKRVYLARDTSLDSDVAVALVKTEGLDADGLTRVRREAQAMGRLRNHPNIVPVFDIGQEGLQPYIVSQLLDGGSVDDRLREAETHKLPIAEALRVAEQIAQALEHAHGLGIIHRDLKPGNVWLARDGTAKLGDFGLAVALDQSRITQEGMLVGTVAYMPPEQAMGRTPDARSDLYALGAMLYEMVAGRPPFLGDDAVTVISQHVSTPAVAPSWHNPEVPPALEALIQKLLAKDPAARPQSAREVVAALQRIGASAPALGAPPPATGPPDNRRRAAWGRFVGRREELEQLKEALEDALGGRGSLAMLVGEPGIGKTRLAEEFAVYARLRGAQFLTGHSYEGAVDVAYSPFVEAFRQYVRARPDVELRRELGVGAPDVATLVSEIRQRFPDLPASPPLQGDAERQRLFGSVTDFLRSATAASPLVLHLDDLHWSDKPSLLLLRHLARHLASDRLLILGTYRDVELDRTHPLAEVLGTLRREVTFHRVLLRGLPSDDVVAYLTALSDEEPDASVLAGRRALADALHRETEGNPFFIGEVMSHLVESGKLFWDGKHWRANVTSTSELGIPEGVREVIGRRLSAVSAGCNRMLTVASAMPAGFSWEVVRATVEGDEAALLDALDEALAARLIREREGGAAASYEFTHALIRQTLYGELSAPRRVLLHRQIGERLETLHAANPAAHAAELAHHFFQAAPGGDVGKAVDYAVRAGERAIAVAALDEAAGHFDRALQALELEQGGDPERHCRVLLALAEVHGRLAALDASRAEAGRAAALARSLGSAELLALAALHFGDEHYPALQLDEARVRLLEEALAAFGSEENELVVRLLRRLSIELAFVDAVRAEQRADQAVAIARRSGRPGVLAYALSARHQALGAAERVEERLLLSRELVDVSTRAGLRGFQVIGHWSLHFDLLEKGDAAGARAQLDGYVALAKQTREPIGLWFSVVLQGLWAILEGRFEAAERMADEAAELARRFEHGGGPMFHAIQISRVRAEQGRLAEMIPVIEGIVKATPVVGFRARLAQLYAEFGREADARREFELLAADLTTLQQDSQWIITLCWVSEACAILRDAKRAAVLYDLLLPHAKRNVVVVNAAVNGSVERYLGLLAATLGRYDDAVRHFEAAIDFDRRIGARPLLARAQVEYARTLLDRSAPGDRERALKLANQALGVAQELGMKLVTERALAVKIEAQGISGADTKHSVYAVASIVQSARPDLSAHTAADGTVTLMFSDMEGFTRMTESLGDIAAHQVVQAHNRIVREQTAAHGGREVELRGDGFLLAFPSARQAALCAISLQRGFAEHNAANGGHPIRIRIGVHTGEAIKDADKFFGKTVIQAFRIADLAKGAEILASSLTVELLRNAGDLRFSAEREVELKGLEGRHRVCSLDWQ